MFLKALLASLAVLAATGLALSAASGGSAGRPQETGLQLEPVVLSAAEQVEVFKGKIIVREVRDTGRKGRTFEAVGTFEAELDDVLAVILDYRHYGEFMPRVERIVVTDEGPAVALIEQHLKLPLGITRRYRLRYTARMGADGFRVDWVKVPWPEVPLSHSVVDTSGHWQVGRAASGGLLALYHVYTDPGHVPLGMKGLALSISKHDLPKVIEAVRSRLRPRERQAPLKD